MKLLLLIIALVAIINLQVIYKIFLSILFLNDKFLLPQERGVRAQNDLIFRGNIQVIPECKVQCIRCNPKPQIQRDSSGRYCAQCPCCTVYQCSSCTTHPLFDIRNCPVCRLCNNASVDPNPKDIGTELPEED